MIVRVTGVGEACPDPDRYIQPLSGESAASIGVSQNADIILKPDAVLLGSMGGVLVASILTVMVGVGYCLHKGWNIPKVNFSGYRSLYMRTDVDHTSKETFRAQNDFSNFKSHLEPGKDLLEEEDDLDDINLNIHADVLAAGQEYLQIFGEKKEVRTYEKK